VLSPVVGLAGGLVLESTLFGSAVRVGLSC